MRGHLNARTAGFRSQLRRVVARKGTARIDAAKRTGKLPSGLEMTCDTGPAE